MAQRKKLLCFGEEITLTEDKNILSSIIGEEVNLVLMIIFCVAFCVIYLSNDQVYDKLWQ
jgi:hypothetical protein